jgi:hypothetical protein
MDNPLHGQLAHRVGTLSKKNHKILIYFFVSISA